MRLVTWNVAARVGRQPEQAEVIARVGADIVALPGVRTVLALAGPDAVFSDAIACRLRLRRLVAGAQWRSFRLVRGPRAGCAGLA